MPAHRESSHRSITHDSCESIQGEVFKTLCAVITFLDTLINRQPCCPHCDPLEVWLTVLCKFFHSCSILYSESRIVGIDVLAQCVRLPPETLVSPWELVQSRLLRFWSSSLLMPGEAVEGNPRTWILFSWKKRLAPGLSLSLSWAIADIWGINQQIKYVYNFLCLNNNNKRNSMIQVVNWP